MIKMYQPKTGKKCSCRKGQERDNCAQCEGTGEVIDFAAIRARDICKHCGQPVSRYCNACPQAIATKAETQRPSERYQGWKNHATWCVNLHISNDEKLTNIMSGIVALGRSGFSDIRDEILSREQQARYGTAKRLKDWIEDLALSVVSERGPDYPRLLAMDLLSGYLEDVDWREIADHWMERAADQVTA